MSFRLPNQAPPGSNSDPLPFSINSKIMLTAIIVILFVVILMVSLHLYSRWYLFRSRRFHLRRSRRAAPGLFFFSDPSSTTSAAVTTRGLNPSVIKSLPIFTFSVTANATATASNAIECAVCLSEFEENESGRVLPNCKHTFHVDCIDMWFHSHSTCPLCRSPVIPVSGDLKSAAEEVAISISDGDDEVSRSEPRDTNRVGEAGTSDGGGDSRRKPAAIEIPRRNIGESEENDLTRSQSFRSPMSRVIYFTRILSRDRRMASSSSSSSTSIGFPPVVSPAASRMPETELDIELGGGGGGRREETR